MVDIKKRLQFVLEVFAKVNVGITIVAAVYIMVFWRDVTLGVSILWQILALSAVCGIGSLILPMEGQKEVSKKAMAIRTVLYFTFVNIATMGSGFIFDWFNITNWKMVAGMEVAIIAVFAAVLSINYMMSSKTAEIMNAKLRERQGREK